MSEQFIHFHTPTFDTLTDIEQVYDSYQCIMSRTRERVVHIDFSSVYQSIHAFQQQHSATLSDEKYARLEWIKKHMLQEAYAHTRPHGMNGMDVPH